MENMVKISWFNKSRVCIRVCYQSLQLELAMQQYEWTN